MASAADAETIAALAIQVFLDTYATEGVRPDLAAEAFEQYGVNAFRARFGEAQRSFVVAERGAALVGFAEVLLRSTPVPNSALIGAELMRLYVQPGAQKHGIGRALLERVEGLAAESGLSALWFTVWEHNTGALAFYAKQGYVVVGATNYAFRGQRYANCVLAKQLAASASGA